MNELENAEIWGPHYWFVLHTIARTYPKHPTEITRKKYYEFIQNIPLFLPNKHIGKQFSKLINEYPVSPYLDTQRSLMKWFHFIHNQVNKMISKKEISFTESLLQYNETYKKEKDMYIKMDKISVYVSIIGCLGLLSYLLYI